MNLSKHIEGFQGFPLESDSACHGGYEVRKGLFPFQRWERVEGSASCEDADTT